ncbi:hypothetical protein BT93_H0385 [Corymbia citriodora subsp. variegata]|nr:hypothetical protein BT93_H0385 [Corymbia citriodora subsp. variegata]
MELPFHGVNEVESTTVSATNKVRAPNTHPPLGKKRANQSEVWDNFSRCINEKTKKTIKVKCIHCGIEYGYNVDHGTSTMWKHLKKCKKYPRTDKKQMLFASRNKDVAGEVGENTIGDGSILTTWKFDQERCRYMLARMIIIDEQPFSMVERVGFRDFIIELQPLFQHLWQFTVARDCMKLYLSERTCLKAYFDKLNSRIALTTDMWRFLILNGDTLHVRCTAHILNLIVKDGLNEVRDSIARIRNVVRYVRSSPTRAKTFRSYIETERITCKSSVCLDVATRWNSTYMMLDTAIKFKKAFQRMEEDDLFFLREIDHDAPQDEDWENATILCKFLKRFYDATKMMSGSSYVTSNEYFEGISMLYKYLNNAANSLDPKLQSMGIKMKEKFDKYYGSLDKINMMVLIAVALDPTKKLTYVKFCFEQIYDDEVIVDDMHDKVKAALECLYKFYEQSFVGSSTKKKDGGSNVSTDSSASNANTDECEIEKTESEDVLDLDLLMWWKSSGSKYKILSLMARDILSIPVTTVASDGGRLDLHSRLVESCSRAD